ncbi:MAG TPA: MarR family winged helix-turn-helix transcriptional regulator [Polyangiaceae bacterium]|nr:MarR family winged helix-turn-helix transcriptional regulator [Polyangiaceae bacterium]
MRDADRSRLLTVATQCTAAKLRQTSRALSRFYDEILEPSGLRGTQFSLLVALSLMGEAPLLRVADELGLDRTTMTRNLAPLERDGLVASVTGPDRRVRLITLTEAGRRRLAKALPLWEKAQRRVIDALGERRWRELFATLQATAAAGEG